MTPRVVAEAGQCNQGQVDLAIRMAGAAHDAGAWGFKTQLLTPEKIAAPDAPKYWDDGFGTTNQREAFTRAGLVDYGAWSAVKEACDEIGIAFFATPFDLDAVWTLAEMGVKHFKIASGDLTYRDLILACAGSGAEVILSTGAAHQDEIDRALEWAPDATILACTLSYPTPLTSAHLARIDALKARYRWTRVGYSDHTSHPATALAAAAMGADMLEVHYTHDQNADDVPDHAMAVDPDGLLRYCEAAHVGATLRGDGTLAPRPEELRARQGARRSAHATRDLPAGHVLTLGDVEWLRPEGPIEPWQPYVGLTLAGSVRAGEPVEGV